VSDSRYADETAYQRAMYDQEYADEQDQNAWERGYKQTAYNDEMERTALNYLNTNRIVTGRYAEILGVPDGTTYEQYYSRYLGGGGNSSPFSETEIDSGKTQRTTTPPSSGQYDESGKRTGTWKDNDGHTYTGYHPDGQWKSQNYDTVWKEVQRMQTEGKSKESILIMIGRMVENDQITDYEAEMMLVNLGYRGTSAGTGRNTIGPNNVQMVQ
jgi:hypothetical protein